MSKSKITRAKNNQIRSEIKAAAEIWASAYCNKKATAQPLADLLNVALKLDESCYTSSQRACLCTHLAPVTKFEMIASLEPKSARIAEHISALCFAWLSTGNVRNVAMRLKFKDALFRCAMFVKAARMEAA